MAEYIDREKYCNEICRCDQNYCDKQSCPIWKAPSEDVAPVVHGKWEYNRDATDFGIGGYICSQCKNKNNNLPCNRVKSVQMFLGAKYCPECGAKMDAEQEEPTE